MLHSTFYILIKIWKMSIQALKNNKTRILKMMQTKVNYLFKNTIIYNTVST